MKQYKILIACEESQRVCLAFRERGFEAFSCDLIECSGGHPEWHIKDDALKIINGKCSFKTSSGDNYVLYNQWDLIIAHPPCTYLTVTGARWFNIDKYGDAARARYIEQEKAINFFMEFATANCEHIAIENPVGVMSTKYRKPNQIIQPYYFGDREQKTTCLWLKNLPNLKPTKIVEPDLVRLKSGKHMSRYHYESWSLPKEERSRVRSKTFPGIAEAMAEQWGDYLLKEDEGKNDRENNN